MSASAIDADVDRLRAPPRDVGLRAVIPNDSGLGRGQPARDAVLSLARS